MLSFLDSIRIEIFAPSIQMLGALGQLGETSSIDSHSALTDRMQFSCCVWYVSVNF